MQRTQKYTVKKPKNKACKECGSDYLPNTSFQTWCSPECGYKLAMKKLKAKQEKEEKEERRILKERKQECLSPKKYIPVVKSVFQKWVRMRDKELPCISCGKTIAGQWDGGHYFKAELYSGLIFHEDNVHKQCSYCNKELDGNLANYRIGLVAKIGEERLKWMEENKDKLRVRIYTMEELINIKKTYQQKLKEL